MTNKAKKINLIVGGFLIMGALVMAASFVWFHSQKEEQIPLAQSTESLMDLMTQLRESPEDPKILNLIGQIFVREEEWARAESFLKRSTEADPSNALSFSFLGLSQYQLGKFADAINSLEKSLNLDNDPDTMLNLAIIYKYRSQEIDKAQKLFVNILSNKKASEQAKEIAQKELTGSMED